MNEEAKIKEVNSEKELIEELTEDIPFGITEEELEESEDEENVSSENE